MSNSNSCTVALKKWHKEYILTTLMKADLTKPWVTNGNKRDEVNDGASAAAEAPGDVLWRREIELYRRELELEKRELELEKRELELARLHNRMAMLREQRWPDPVNDKEAAVEDRRCSNCGAREHFSANYFAKYPWTTCFECGKYAHIAAQSKKRSKAEKTVITFISSIQRCMKNTIFGDQVIPALIDTGSDISLMRISEYEMVGAPRLQASQEVCCGIGNYRAAAIGEFLAYFTIDNYQYFALIRVIPDDVLWCGLVLRIDFLNRIDFNLKRGSIIIRPATVG